MKKLLKRFMSYSVYRKTLFAYAISVVMIVVLVLASTYGILSTFIRENSTRNSELMLEQFRRSSESLQEDVQHVISLVYSNPDALTFMSAKKENKIYNYYLFQSISDYKATYTYIVDISVINFDTGTCVQSYGTNVAGNRNYYFVQDAIASGESAIPRELTFYLPRQRYDAISFYRSFPAYNSAIVVDINARRMYLEAGSLQEDSNIYIIDSTGRGISQNASELLGETQYSDYFSRVIAEQANGRTKFVYDDSKNQMMVFFTKSESLDWWYIDAQSYSSFYRAYQNISTIFIAVALCFLLGCIVISVLFSKRMREPLRALVKKYQVPGGEYYGPDELQNIDNAMRTIEHERYLNSRYIDSQFLKNTILGEEIPFFVSKEKLREMSEAFLAEHYTILLIRLEKKEETQEEKGAEEFHILRFVISNLAGEIFGEKYRCRTVDLGGQDVAVLLMTEDGLKGEEYVLCYQRLQEFVRENVGIKLYGALGNTVSSQREIFLSYKNALQYLNMGNLVGREGLIDSSSALNVNYKEKNEKLEASIEEYTALNYANPNLSLKGIAQNFHLSSTYLGKIFKSVRGCTYSSYLANYRLEQSKVLMLETGKSINEIALEVGFANAAYYATVFKKVYGMTPSTYRNNMK